MTITQLSVKQMRIIGIMLLLSQVGFLVVVLFLMRSDESYNENNRAFALAVPGMAVLVVPMAFFLFRKLINQAKAQPDIGQRMGRYRGAVLVQLAMLEGILLFTGVAMMVTHENMLLYVWVIVFALMVIAFLNGTKASFAEEVAQGDSRLMA